MVEADKPMLLSEISDFILHLVSSSPRIWFPLCFSIGYKFDIPLMPLQRIIFKKECLGLGTLQSECNFSKVQEIHFCVKVRVYIFKR